MIEIINKNRCCGCSACSEICPNNCITMNEDEEGFLYPVVDKRECINCGLCERVCPILNKKTKHKPIRVLAAFNSDESIRKASSSGGIFHALATDIINKGGVVFGTKYNSQWGAELSCVDAISGLSDLMVSKYVQSSVNHAYYKCKEILKKGTPVLFVGTSCQISGLRFYLRNNYENLITVEVICHGVPSPRVWRLYLNEICNKVNPHNQRSIKKISFRLKDKSWSRFNFYVEFANDTNNINSFHMDNSYMKAFVRNLILRPSCYCCQFKSCSSCADISLGDYWSVSKFHPEMNDDKGTSLVLINSKKGNEIIERLNLIKQESTYKNAIYCNPAIVKSHKSHANRSKFFGGLERVDVVSDWIEDCLKISRLRKLQETVNRYLILITRKINYYIKFE